MGSVVVVGAVVVVGSVVVVGVIVSALCALLRGVKAEPSESPATATSTSALRSMTVLFMRLVRADGRGCL